jgi:hypothetical protein
MEHSILRQLGSTIKVEAEMSNGHEVWIETPVYVKLFNAHGIHYEFIAELNGNSVVWPYAYTTTNCELEFEIPAYVADGDYEMVLTTYGKGPNDKDGWQVETLSVNTPYYLPANPTEEDKLYARLVVSIINAATGGQFGVSYRKIEGEGLGTDYFPVPMGTTGVFKVWENNVMVFETPSALRWPVWYGLSYDGTAVTAGWNGAWNRLAGVHAASHYDGHIDTDTYGWFGGQEFIGHTRRGLFPKDSTFAFLLQMNGGAVPQDIKDAAYLLFNDMKCGKMDQLNRYISEYSTDQFKLRFASGAHAGTGNKIVDDILGKYNTTVLGRIGVL